jgi:CRP-like cAMP-binding protein
MVIDKGAPGYALYIILGGTAKVLGKPASRPLRTGDYFGELSVLDGSPRSATVVAASELHVMKLPRESFLELAHHSAELSLRMLTTLGSQVRRIEARAA